MAEKKKTTKQKEVDKKEVAAVIPMPRGLVEIQKHVMANVPLLYVVTHEEDRFLREFRQHITVKGGYDMVHWSAYTGLVRDEDVKIAITCNKKVAGAQKELPEEFKQSNNPMKALEAISQYKVPTGKKGTMFFMKDMHTVMNEPVPRQLRDTLQWLAKRVESAPIVMIITAPEIGYSAGRVVGLPVSLEKDLVVINYDLLNREEIESIIHHAVNEINTVKTKPIKLTKDDVQAIARAAQGMTFEEIRRAIGLSIIEHGTLNVQVLLAAKKQAIKKSEVLEIIDVTPDISEVGGMDNAKEYLDTFKCSFTDEAKAFGVDPLDGVIFTGIPGTGKSLIAKAAASSWQLPLLRLDIGKVMGSLVGQSEQNMRKALKQAEACAPCILWVDEIEKALSGTGSSNFSDGGTTSRVFGTLLTWMQEKQGDVVVLATANSITGLPPELVRRFNEIFFVDIPVKAERSDIFEIHLNKRGRDPEKFDMDALVEASNDYTGAEIEKGVKEGIASAFASGKKKVETTDIVDALVSIKPLAVLMREQINEIIKWARDRARSASSLAEKERMGSIEEMTADLNDSMGGLTNLVEKAEDGEQSPAEA